MIKTSSSRLWHWTFVLVALALPLRAGVSVPAAPPEWILVHAPNLQGNLDRPLRYRPEGTSFVIENGTEFFNRPLYCANTAFRADGGDKPEFSLYVPGRGGNLRFGIKTDAGAKWLNDAEKIVTRYQPGSLVYDISDPLAGNRRLQLTVLPLSGTRGIIARAELNGAGPPIELIWAFGGANGMRGSRAGDIGCEREPISQFFQLRPDQCRSNDFSITVDGFMMQSRVVTIAGVASPGASHVVVDANQWANPAGLLASGGTANTLTLVAGRIPLPSGRAVHLALQAVVDPTKQLNGDELPDLFASAEEQRREIAERVVVETPDPYINAAAAAINVAGNGIWDEAQGAYMHGAVAWRSKLLGWRGPYTGDALGWHERARRHLTYWGGQQMTNRIPDALPPADPTANLSRNEPALHSNGTMSRSHYDMNLVYIDALFRHLLWTGDLEFARRQWPVIERHLAWERRLFRREFGPEKLPLYEAYAAIWASDDLQYHGGGATHSTAYNLFHNRMAARFARLLGKDAAPYEREAELIAKAMKQYLWLEDRGWYGEWKDYLGLQQVHPNAALWTFYHTLDSGAATPLEAWQMTRFVDTQLAHIPVEIRNPKSEIRNDQGLLTSAPTAGYYTLPTSSWMPYRWSLNNVVVAEVAHASLAFWQAGRDDEAFKLFKGTLLSTMYVGLCPGNVGMATCYDMARREAQRDFGDAVGMCSRTMIEGLFGVQPDAVAGELRIQPGFPPEWNDAKMRHPDFTFGFHRDGMTESFSIEPKFAKAMSLRLQVPALREGIESVTINGRPAQWRALEESVGRPRVEIAGAAAPKFEVVIRWRGAEPIARGQEMIAPKGEALSVAFGAATVREVADPQRALDKPAVAGNSFRAMAVGASGHHTVFAKLRQGDLTWWQPVVFEIRPAFEIISETSRDESGSVSFRVRNNTSKDVDRSGDVRIGVESVRGALKLPALSMSEVFTLPGAGRSLELLPGSVPVRIDLGYGKSVEGIVSNWKLRANPQRLPRFRNVDLGHLFNDKVTQMFRNQYLSPRSPFCSLAIPAQGIGSWCNFRETFDVNDSGLRAAAAQAGGKFVLPNGVPFGTPTNADAKNIAFTSQWDNYPRDVTVPLSGTASHIYLLMAGSSNPMQSRFDNGEVIVTYADGSTNRLALHNPTTWWPIDQDYFIDDFAFRRNEPIPPRVDLRTGRVRLLDPATFKGQGREVPGGSANVLDLPLDSGKELKSLTVRTLANEVVIGLMAATLAR